MENVLNWRKCHPMVCWYRFIGMDTIQMCGIDVPGLVYFISVILVACGYIVIQAIKTHIGKIDGSCCHGCRIGCIPVFL